MGKLLIGDFAKKNRKPKRRRTRGLALVMSATTGGVRDPENKRALNREYMRRYHARRKGAA
jgi:hypothetical protein